MLQYSKKRAMKGGIDVTCDCCVQLALGNVYGDG